MRAVISECGTYRYMLTRETGIEYPTHGAALFIMLNPSTADATVDDPTIRRCVGFAKSWGCKSIVVANLFALRATDPRELKTHASPVGPENDSWLEKLSLEHETVVFAWGSNAPTWRANQVAAMFTHRLSRRMCLGTTKAGAPKHPLYLRADSKLIDWQPLTPPSQLTPATLQGDES